MKAKKQKRSQQKPPDGTSPPPEDRRTENQRELDLLRSDPGQLVVTYGDMIATIAWNSIRRGMFPPSQHKELIQTVTAKLLELAPRIRRRYDGSSLLRTYVSAIIVNILKRLARGRKHAEKSLPPVEKGTEDPALELREHDIQVFVRRLGRILALFAELEAKLTVILKCYYRIPLEAGEVTTWHPKCDPFSRDELLSLSRSSAQTLAHGALFASLAVIVGEAERRAVRADSLRKWTDHRIGEILRLLNGNPPQSAFERRTLGELLERLSNSSGERTI